MEIPNTLFSESKRKELCLGRNVTPKQKQATKEWKERLDNNTFQGESHYKDYLRDLMIDALGFTRDKIKAEEGEKNTRMDYSYVPPSGKGGVLFELKDRKKKPFKAQGYDTQGQETPVDQALTYIGKNPDIDYAIVTNFEEFVLVTRFEWYTQCHHFTFPPKGMKLLDSEILEFCTIFSKESIDSKFIAKLTHETIIEEKNLSDDFYKLYHQTRLMLIQAFQEKTNIDHDNAIKIAQTYLNRLIFLFFAEDNNLVKDKMFSAGIIDLLDSGDVKDGTTKVSDHIQTIFSWMNEGSHEIDHKLGFNGEFFKEPIDRNAFFYDFKKFDDITNKIKLPKNVKLNKEYQKSIDRYNGKISPIITNLLMMDSYNFGGKSTTGEYISVNILGHIFEQSIGDLEELHSKETSQKKKDGVFYTPDYITTYICKNTIIPYLSKKNSTEPEQLVSEYVDDIAQLEKNLEQIKILDPACGSGAFLVKAVDTLISIYNEIQEVKETKGVYHVTKKGQKSGITKNETFDKKIEMERMRGIIQNNIYGVDVNSESIEITKLSLFLKIASKNKQLIGLSQRIMNGNSLIDDKTIDEKSFNWKSNFAEILDDNISDNGFDIIIGNPPYVRQEKFKELKNNLKENYEIFVSTADLYTYFYECGINKLRKNGILGFISSNKFMRAKYGFQLRNFLKYNTTLKKIIDFGDAHLFDAVTNTAIIITKKEIQNNNKFSFLKDINSKNSVLINQDKLDESAWTLANKEILNVKKKIELIGIPLKEWNVKINYGLKTGFNEAYLIDTDTKMNFCKKDQKNIEIIKPIIRGRDIGKYFYKSSGLWLINPHNGYTINSKKISPINVKKDFPIIYKHLEGFNKRSESKLEKRTDHGKHWTNLRDCAFLNDFKSEKIIWLELTSKNKFAYSTEEEYILAGAFMMTGESLKYLLAFLNSSLCKFYFKLISNSSGMGTIQWKKFTVERIPIPKINKNEQLPIIHKVNQILILKKTIEEISRKFQDRISQNLPLEKFTNKLSNFYTLTFEEFFKELKKQKIELTLKQQEEWEEYFYDKQNMMLKNIEKINQFELDINSIIYKLYGLNEDEIRIVKSEIE